MAYFRCSNSSGGGTNLNISIVDKYMKNGTYTRTVEVDLTKDYLIYSYYYTSSGGVASTKLYSLYKGVLTLEESTGTSAPSATISDTTLQVKYSGASYWNGYVVVQLD